MTLDSRWVWLGIDLPDSFIIHLHVKIAKNEKYNTVNLSDAIHQRICFRYCLEAG